MSERFVDETLNTVYSTTAPDLPQTSGPLLDVRGITKSYPAHDGSTRRRIVENLSFSVFEGEVVSIIGPSGCGKTTLLRIISGLVGVDEGECLLSGQAIRGPVSDIALVFQFFNLLPWRTAAKNVTFPLEIAKVQKDEQTKRASTYLELVGLTGFEQHYPYQLSGGMQQRVGLARALVVEPKLLLMDEPFGSLDQQTGDSLRDEVLRIHQKTRITTLLITHNIDEAIYMSNRILVLGGNPSSVIETATVSLPEPRWQHEVHRMPEFSSLRRTIRTLLDIRTMGSSQDDSS